jgi:hypothetical protein
MPAFVDLPKANRIFRVGGGFDSTGRALIGRISKASMKIEPVPVACLSAEEAIGAPEIADGSVRSDLLKRAAALFNLPVMLREAPEYFENEASGSEKKLVINALAAADRRRCTLGRDVGAKRLAL